MGREQLIGPTSRNDRPNQGGTRRELALPRSPLAKFFNWTGSLRSLTTSRPNIASDPALSNFTIDHWSNASRNVPGAPWFTPTIYVWQCQTKCHARPRPHQFGHLLCLASDIAEEVPVRILSMLKPPSINGWSTEGRQRQSLHLMWPRELRYAPDRCAPILRLRNGRSREALMMPRISPVSTQLDCRSDAGTSVRHLGRRAHRKRPCSRRHRRFAGGKFSASPKRFISCVVFEILDSAHLPL